MEREREHATMWKDIENWKYQWNGKNNFKFNWKDKFGIIAFHMIAIVEFYLYLRSSILTFLLLMINDLEVGDELLGCSVPAKISCMKKMRMKMVQVRVWKSRTKISLSQNSKKKILFHSCSPIFFCKACSLFWYLVHRYTHKFGQDDTTNCTPSLQMLKGLWRGQNCRVCCVFSKMEREKKEKGKWKENLEGCLKCENSGWGVVLCSILNLVYR